MEISKVIIGVEVHVELRTASKMFCGCSAEHFAKEPNTLTCPVCLGLPGALPVPNKKAIDWTILFGLAMNCKIPKNSQFDRKNYFYPDLPKGFQISQYQHPLAVSGQLKLDGGQIIKIRRVHLEEDTAKLLHETIESEKVTLIDFNRSGVALMEIVSEPDISSSEEAKEYLEKVQQLVRYLEISDADMEKGSMRCEPNVNLEIKDENKVFYTPITELKNINSFRFAKKAIEFEIDRQFKQFLEDKIEKAQGNKQTRGWDETKQATVPQREKEEANDYRYFPEPDIPPLIWSEGEIKNYESRIKNYELPWTKKMRFIEEFGLTDYQAEILTTDKNRADYFEKAIGLGKIREIRESEIANVIINKRAPENLSPESLINYILESNKTIDVDDEEIDNIIKKLLAENPDVIEGYKNGKPQALGMIVGLIKKEKGIVVDLQRIIGLIK